MENEGALSAKHALSMNIAIFAKRNKRAQREGCVKTKLICIYKRREKKEKNTQKF